MISHREFVEPGTNWEGPAADGSEAFHMLTQQGLLPRHCLLDFGCGALRVGRWLIPFLNKGNYFGIEPNLWLVEMARLEEMSEEAFAAKRPTFDGNEDFRLDVFDRRFDYVLISDIFMHAADHQIDTILEGVSQVLEPGGVCILDMLVDSKSSPHWWTWWVYPHVIKHQVSCLQKNGLRCAEVGATERQYHTVVWFRLEK